MIAFIIYVLGLFAFIATMKSWTRDLTNKDIVQSWFWSVVIVVAVSLVKELVL